MDVMAEANRLEAAGRAIVQLETGQPSTGAPALVREAAIAAVAGHTLGYTEALGLRPLRARIAAHYGEKHGLDIDPGRVVVTTGTSAGLMIAYLALSGAGGRVGVARPSYPCYRNIALALGMTLVEIPTLAADGFQPNGPALSRFGHSLDLVVLGSPANPTGAVLSRAQLAEIAAWSRDAGVPVVLDEVYHGLTYGAAATTMLAVDPDAVVLNGFSKYYAMTGWRLGWMVVPPRLVRAVECLAQNLYIAPPTLSQHAGIAGFDATEELEINVARYAANRRLLLDALPRLGVTVPVTPEGAFYIYARLPDAWPDSVALARRWLEEIGVAVTPGIDFDTVDGRRHIRLAYAGATLDVAEAVRRLDAWSF
jgi:aspartate/methionine/tyrosine aminotransferase